MIRKRNNRKIALLIPSLCLVALIGSCNIKDYGTKGVNRDILTDSKLESTIGSESIIGEAASFIKDEYTIYDIDYYDTDEENIPNEKLIAVYNPLTGKDEMVNARLVEVKEDSNQWIEQIDVENTFYQPTDSDTSLNLYSVKPVWQGEEIDILSFCELDNQGYRISDAYWKGEVKQIDDGISRTAVYVFKKDLYGVAARYEGKVEAINLADESQNSLYYVNHKRDKALLQSYKDLNSDTYGIIRIEGTKLNHPLMRSLEDEGFYLWHDLEKRYNSHGVPFLTLESDLEKNYGNSIIYGHRLEDGDVFGEICNYENLEYYKEHPVIETVTDKGNCRWLIIGYYLVCNDDEDTFRYFDDCYFNSKAEYEEYMKNVEERNWLNVPYDTSIDDGFITLSSCSKEKTGDRTNRMVLMAVRIEYDYAYEGVVNDTTMNTNPLLPEKIRRE